MESKVKNSKILNDPAMSKFFFPDFLKDIRMIINKYINIQRNISDCKILRHRLWLEVGQYLACLLEFIGRNLPLQCYCCASVQSANHTDILKSSTCMTYLWMNSKSLQLWHVLFIIVWGVSWTHLKIVKVIHASRRHMIEMIQPTYVMTRNASSCSSGSCFRYQRGEKSQKWKHYHVDRARHACLI